MIQSSRKILGIVLFFAVLMGFVYFSTNQAGYDMRTLAPGNFTDMASENLTFDPGTYSFTFHYTDVDDAQVQIIRTQTADSNNTLPTVLACETLEAGGQTVVMLTLDETVYDVQIRFTKPVELGFTNIESIGMVWTDTYFLLCLLLCIGFGVVYSILQHRKNPSTLIEADTGDETVFQHLLLLLVAVFATLPILRDYLVKGHDLLFHLQRIESLKNSILDGQFPVRIGTSFLNGAGYASPILYPELLLYIPACFRLCGVSLLVSYQVFVFLANLATVLVTYHAIKRLTQSNTIGLMTAIVYTLGVNRMVMLYTRCAIGEVLALIFFPCVLLGMEEVLHRGKVSKWLIVGMSGLIQTHVISVEIAAIFCALYTVSVLILRKTTLRNLGKLLLCAGITIAVNLWFLVPFFRFTAESLRMFNYTTRTALHATYPAQWFASFVSAFENAHYLGTTAEMPLSVGVLSALGLLLFVITYPKQSKPLQRVGIVSAGMGLLALVVSSTVFPWTYIPQLPLVSELLLAIQFPWRFLGIAGFFFALVFGIALHGLEIPNQRLLLGLCIVVAVFNISPYIDQYVQSDEQEIAVQSKSDYTSYLEYRPMDYIYADMDVSVFAAHTTQLTTTDDITITNYTKSGTHITFTYTADTEQQVTTPLILYPGYRVLLNDTQELTPTAGDNHMLTFTLPAGTGTVTLWYAGFWYWNVANFISLFSVLGLLVMGLLRARNQKQKQREA